MPHLIDAQLKGFGKAQPRGHVGIWVGGRRNELVLVHILLGEVLDLLPDHLHMVVHFSVRFNDRYLGVYNMCYSSINPN